jgi:hypothetical protein
MLIKAFLGGVSIDRATQLVDAANKMLEAFFGMNIISNVLLTALIGES